MRYSKITMRNISTASSSKSSKIQNNNLRKVAVRYGFSPDAFMQHIIADATQALLIIPEESLAEYKNAKEIKDALPQALRDEREGKILRTLPKSVIRIHR